MCEKCLGLRSRNLYGKAAKATAMSEISRVPFQHQDHPRYPLLFSSETTLLDPRTWELTFMMDASTSQGTSVRLVALAAVAGAVAGGAMAYQFLARRQTSTVASPAAVNPSARSSASVQRFRYYVV